MSLPQKWTLAEVLALKYIKGINLRQAKEIVEKFLSYEDFIHSDFASIFKENTLFDDGKINPVEEAEKQIELCYKQNVKIVTIWDENYPSLLKEIPVPPFIIFVKGELQKADALSISIVGTRANSLYGDVITKQFVSYFAKNGIIITSGLANGIDTISHLATIKAKGITYAVLGSGIDKISPSTSQKNAHKIIDSGGAIISEYPCGTKALPAYFPQRNRIISGISKATIVIESDSKGGSLITARFALDQGRDVFAVPGDIRKRTSKGTNMLIKKSLAIPALSPEQISEDLGFLQLFKEEKNDNPAIQNLKPSEKKILDLISYEQTHIDVLASKSGMSITDTMVALLNLEFNGLIRQLPGKHYIKLI